MSKFIGYTVGLECFVGDTGIKSVSVEYSEEQDGKITLQAVSGRNLQSFGGNYHATITRSVFESRPVDAYDKIPEAVWALDMCKLCPAALDA